jgi:hypothetical protein
MLLASTENHGDNGVKTVRSKICDTSGTEREGQFVTKNHNSGCVATKSKASSRAPHEIFHIIFPSKSETALLMRGRQFCFPTNP